MTLKSQLHLRSCMKDFPKRRNNWSVSCEVKTSERGIKVGEYELHHSLDFVYDSSSKSSTSEPGQTGPYRLRYKCE